MRVRDVFGGRASGDEPWLEAPPHDASPLQRSLGGYEVREGQLAMAEAVEAAFEHERSLFVEAGTGTGKTLAYLIPAILSGKKVIVSTATRALQDQIFEKDVPLVAEVLGGYGVRFRASLMKGLSNYLCKRRFAELRRDDGARFGVDRDLARIERWALETESGDRVELPMLPDDSRGWRDVQSSTETRIGKTCPHHEACFVTRMKRDAEESELVIVNHHLFFADLALRRGSDRRRQDMASVLPPYDAVIFDEAHQLEEIATLFFGVRASSARVESLLRDAERAFVATGLSAGDGLGASRPRGPDARPLLDRARDAGQRFFSSLAPPGRGPEAKRTLAAADLEGENGARYERLVASVHELAAYAEREAPDEAVALIARRAADLEDDLRAIVEGARAPSEAEDADAPPEAVAWVESREKSVSLGASPVHVGHVLGEALFGRVATVVCTSATLATNESFHFAKARLGAPADVEELIVGSPFAFEARAGFYVARDLPEPTSAEFEARAAERALELIEVTGGGAFVLSTSNRAMRALHAALARRTKLPLFLQGEAPKNVLLARFRAARDAVLVATMSFWEGVDVPGQALRLVILDKIPFAVPTDPLVAARSAEVERQGGNAFAQYSVPSAAILLKQGFGRLVRTRQDSGLVALLDRRAVTRGYGRMLLASLPPAKRLGSMDEVRAFWEELE